MDKIFVTCGHCKGSGRLPTYTRGGLCHGCGGDKGAWRTPAEAARLERARVRRAEVAAEKRRARWVCEPEPQIIGEIPAWMEGE